VANDYGYLTRKQRERERLRRARKRAGVVKGENAAQKAGRQEDGSFYTAAGARRDAETTRWTPAPKPYPKRKATAATKRISADYQDSLRRPVQGENARDKARVGKQARAREAFESVTTAKTPADRQRAKIEFAKSLIGLTAAEKRDLGSYSGAFSRRQQKETLRKNTSVPDEAIGAVLGVKPSEAIWSFTHPRQRLAGERPDGREPERFTSGPFAGATRPQQDMALPWLFGRGRQAAEVAEKTVRPKIADDIVEAMPEARRTRAAQEALRTPERAKRAARGEAAAARAGGGEAGLRASRAEMRGELPRLSFNKLADTYGKADSEVRRHLQPKVQEALDFIRAHPSHSGLEYKIDNTQEALLKALDGVTPTKAEIRDLIEVFGEDAARHFKWAQAREKVVKLLNLPRSMMATGDLSRTLRQNLVMGTRHPVVWKRNFQDQVRAAKNPAVARAMLEEIKLRPRYEEMEDVGLALTELRGATGKLEEDFIGAEYAERIPGFGKVARASNRAFTVGGAKFRADLYDLLMDQAEAAGKTLTKQEKIDIASVINGGTGRGNARHLLGVDSQNLERAFPLAAAGFFSPRLIASRIGFLNPVYYASLSGPARRQAAEALISTVTAGSAVLWLASQIPGVDVGLDPRSADFGKIRVGDTRIDIWGGFQQYIVNGYRLAVQETKSSTTGEVREQSRDETLSKFLWGKAAPVPGYAHNLWSGEGPAGQPFHPLKEAGKLFVPLNLQSAHGAYTEGGPGAAAAGFGLGFVGVGNQTYRAEPKEKKSRSLRSGSSDRPKSLRAGRKKSKSLRG
jgi:hypothetical protein